MIPQIRKRLLKQAKQHLFFIILGQVIPALKELIDYKQHRRQGQIGSEQKQYDNITLGRDCSLNSICLHYIALRSFLTEKISYTVLGFLI